VLVIPADWKLVAQMPIGNKVAEAGEKQFAPLEGRLLIQA